ncbi:MAG: outer membrane protein assembly factor BamD [Deltaproteobacteria bacterium]|nr:outer membrane protein assembly factor BamD [Deltaproteobacteria bacterium]
MFRPVAIISIALCALGCATTLVRGTPKNAEDQYTQAMEDLKDGLYPEAVTGFTDLKTKYPYSKLAALADLRIADTNYERGKFVEAIDGYRAFLKYHPSHEEAAYAMFRIGEAYAEQIPSDWWFLPPSSEKDQGNTRLAISAYRDFLARYGDSKHAADGRKRLDECRAKLAEHELYVASFYFKRGRFAAAAARADGLVRDYPGLGLDRDALLISMRAHAKTGANEPAAAAAARLQKDFPNTSEAREAADFMQPRSANNTPPPPAAADGT